MQSLRENKFMYNTLAAGYVSIFLCVTEVFPPLNDCFELVPLPADVVQPYGLPFQLVIALLMVLDTGAVYVIDKLIE